LKPHKWSRPQLYHYNRLLNSYYNQIKFAHWWAWISRTCRPPPRTDPSLVGLPDTNLMALLGETEAFEICADLVRLSFDIINQVEHSLGLAPQLHHGTLQSINWLSKCTCKQLGKSMKCGRQPKVFRPPSHIRDFMDAEASGAPTATPRRVNTWKKGEKTAIKKANLEKQRTLVWELDFAVSRFKLPSTAADRYTRG